jgi:serine/threonine protein kinase/Flp pilus assembly protein TadD
MGKTMPTPDSIFPNTPLVDRLADELARRWHAGDHVLVEEFLTRYPELANDPQAAAELIYEEVCLRQEHGQEQVAEDLLRRFPKWRQELQVLLQCHDFLQPAPARPTFPAPGERLGGFRLVAELGRGGHGRVFVATQTALGDRPVVLKLAPRSGEEHLSLARLQHTHIVPLYSVEDDPARGLRALCMPYFGGATLAQLLELLLRHPLGRRLGKHVLEAIEDAEAAAPLRLPVEGPACQFLAKVSYARAVCWLGSCLAEALQYTHERGLVHLDIKPSNVLWAADGQPMLLDLHLARAPIVAGSFGAVWLGGTPAYMAPEQRLAMQAVEEGRKVPVTVDGRADLYSLGLLLAEALGGASPSSGEALATWLRSRNPQVTVGLADVLGKCLEEDPRKRYHDAASLADDLRRHLADRPLRGAANRSLAERWRKWRRRRPYQQTVLGFALVAAAAVSLAAIYVDREARQARAALVEGTDLQRRNEAGAARDAWRRGLATAESLPFQDALAKELRAKLRLAERAAAVQELHVLAERLRALYGADDRSGSAAPDAARAIEGHCRAFWENRDIIARRLSTQVLTEREQVYNDLLDLAILWTHLRVRLAGKNESQVRREALEVLGQAEAIFGPSSVLDCEYRAHAAALGLPTPEKKAASAPRKAWEHFAVGRAHFQAGNLEEAAVELDQALALRPQDFWPNFFKGKCAYQRKLYEDSILAFTACAVLAPDKAWCYYNRGLAYEALKKPERALKDYDHALRLDGRLALAALNRGMLHYHAMRYGPALDDIHLAQVNGADPALVHYNRALVLLAEGDHNAALKNLHEALRYEPSHKEARALYESMQIKQ